MGGVRGVKFGALRWLSVALIAGLMEVAGSIPAAAEFPPESLAAAGDSITQAYNVDWCCYDRNNPQYSWSTGDNPAVNSLYLRLLSRDPIIAGKNWNLSQAGARMWDLRGQLRAAAALRADLVTVQIGTNDVCADSLDLMTPTSLFRSQYQQALIDFFAAAPDAHLYQLSIPNWYLLWAYFHGDPSVQWFWDNFRVCQTMLASTNSEFVRMWTLSQEMAYNQALQEVCSAFSHCIWDGNATFNATLTAADFSPIDYSHPSLAGQNHLAQLAWDALRLDQL
jgi:lysophospholipase L1-like esterase